MLVLSRYVDQTINVGDIVITVIEIRGMHGRRPYVKLGITAPQEVPILRPDAKCTVPKKRPRLTGKPKRR